MRSPRLTYTLDGEERHHELQVQDDWADMEVVARVMSDLEEGGRRFYARENGQAMTLFYLDAAAARRIGELAGDVLDPVTAGDGRRTPVAL